MNLNKFDLLWCVRRLPPKLRDIMKREGVKMCVAGGYVRSCVANEPISDVDIFGPGKTWLRGVASELISDRKLVETDNAFTVLGHKYPLQLIHRWTFEHPTAVIPSFDFTIAAGAFWFEHDKDGAKDNDGKLVGRWQSACHQTFYEDLANKRLVYTNPVRNEDAGGSMLRVLKFYQRGYRIPLDSLGAVIGRLVCGVDASLLHKNDPEHLARVLTGLLREVDPLVDFDHVFHLASTEEADALK